MKKIFFRMLPVVATGFILTACNNAEQVKKQVDDQNAKIQSLVDAKMGDLQTQADQQCAATVDSLAQVQYDAYLASKGNTHVTHKPKPKPKVKEEKPKGNDAVNRGGTNETNKSTVIKREGTDQGNKSNVINRSGATKTP